MSSKAQGMRDGSIVESQLQPHLRGIKRRAGGSSLTINTSTTADEDVALAIYTGTTHSMDVPSRSIRTMPITAATDEVAAVEVSETDPFTFTADESRVLRFVITATGNGIGSVSLRVNDTDVASAPCGDGRCDVFATVYIVSGDVVTAWFTAHAECTAGLTTTAQLDTVRVQISEGA